MYKDIWEEFKEKSADQKAAARFMCDLQSLSESQCDGCPAYRWCGIGHNGFEELFKKKQADVFTDDPVIEFDDIDEREGIYGVPVAEGR